jgi:DNA-binding IclR family transcriptional regulator
LTVRSIEQILRLLRDGQWHDLNEIANKTQLSNLKLQIVTEFLAKYSFIKLDRKNGRVRLSRTITKFFA